MIMGLVQYIFLLLVIASAKAQGYEGIETNIRIYPINCKRLEKKGYRIEEVQRIFSKSYFSVLWGCK